MSKIQAAITGIAAYLPPYVLTNAELEQMVETSDEWIVTRTGIKERRILKGEGKGTSVMGTEAAKALLEKMNVDPMDVDGVICATITPDMMFPTTSNLIASNIGAKKAFGFDLLAACSGFLFALETAVNYVKSGAYNKIIVLGADKMSSVTNYKDRNSCILFGDAAAAVMVEPIQDGNGIKDSIIRSDAVGKDLIYLKAGGSAYPATEQTIANGDHYFFQDGKSVFKYAVTQMADVSVELMQRNQLTAEDISYFIPHQANKRIIDGVANRLGMSMDKVVVNIEKYGNTTAATIPLCLWEWEDKFNKGDNIILSAFGAGFTWGATYLKWAY